MFDWLNYDFIVKESYTQVPYYFQIIAFHIEITLFVDEAYELIQELDGDNSEAQANVVILTEALNSDSKEPKFTDSIDITTGKPRCIIPIF